MPLGPAADRRSSQEFRLRYAGRCHCGRIEVAFEPRQAASDLQLRECACSFRPPVSVSFEGESAAERTARRRRAWAPAVVRETSP